MKTKRTVEQIFADIKKQDSIMMNALAKISKAYLELNKLVEATKKANEKAKAVKKPKSSTKTASKAVKVKK